MVGHPHAVRGARVLVVEDEYVLADDIAKALTAAGAVTVGPVGYLGDAEALLDRETLDAAIIDINLHGEMATGLAERLRQQDLPCLIVSGYSEEALPESLRGLPRLEKPVDEERVVSALAKELQRERA